MHELRKKINTKAIAAEHKECREHARQLTKLERTDQGRQWGIRNAPLTAYEKKFREVLPKGKSLALFVTEKLTEKEGEAVGLEVGGIGSSLFAGFPKGLFKKTAGVALTDSRETFASDPRPHDRERNHTVIAGDMLRRDTKKAVEEWLDGDNIDFLIEEMEGGIIFLPDDPFFMAKEAHYWYQKLARGGIVLAEVPRAFRDLISVWQEAVAEKAPPLWVDSVSTPRKDILLLEKTPESPEALPVLTVDSVRKTIFAKKRAGEDSLVAQFLVEETV